MAYALLWRSGVPRVRYLTRESARRVRSYRLINALINCDFEFKSTFMLTFPKEMVHGKTPAEQIDIATEKFAKLRLVIHKEIKAGRLHIKSFEYFLMWEFRPETGDVHAHMLTDSYIKKRTMTELLKRAGMGSYNYLQGIKKSDSVGYRQVVKYAAKYVYKDGWNVVKGRRRYSMSKAVSESVNRYLGETKKPFDGEIVRHEEVAVINRDQAVVVLRSNGQEDIVEAGHYLYDSPIRLDQAEVNRLETWDPRYKVRSGGHRKPRAVPAVVDQVQEKLPLPL